MQIVFDFMCSGFDITMGMSGTSNRGPQSVEKGFQVFPHTLDNPQKKPLHWGVRLKATL